MQKMSPVSQKLSELREFLGMESRRNLSFLKITMGSSYQKNKVDIAIWAIFPRGNIYLWQLNKKEDYLSTFLLLVLEI